MLTYTIKYRSIEEVEHKEVISINETETLEIIKDILRNDAVNLIRIKKTDWKFHE